MSEHEVQAAGCVVWRSAAELEVLLVHRPRYDDWSLPKGKLDPGESFEEAAVREVEEETGCQGSLGAELDSVVYEDHKGRSKIVRYWLMSADLAYDIDGFEANDEVDVLAWMNHEDAAAALTYDHDRSLLDQAVGLLADR